jgi:hypothetical protein
MEHQDAELSDVVVVIEEEPGMSFKDVVARLQSEGLSVSDTDEPNGVVEGTLESAKAKGLEKLPFVKYVRCVFNYTADFPPGDPRNMDPADDKWTDDDDGR